jgi:hypothetical protein
MIGIFASYHTIFVDHLLSDVNDATLLETFPSRNLSVKDGKVNSFVKSTRIRCYFVIDLFYLHFSLH